MKIKLANSKEPQIAELRSLLDRPDLTPEMKHRIEREIRNIGSGDSGEREAAYYIDREFGASKNWAIIHDLRLEYQNESVQIDHLIINRLMEIWVCESKRFSEGISINEHGECAFFYRGTRRGISSPLIQNQHHVRFLKKFLAAGEVKLPTRLGFAIGPSISSLVLVATCATIERPKVAVPGIETLIKSDHLGDFIDRAMTRSGNPVKAIGQDTLRQFTRRLAAAHHPREIPWLARFGLPKNSPDAKHLELPMRSRSPVCVYCGINVSGRVANYCRSKASRFRNKIYCFKCQQKQHD